MRLISSTPAPSFDQALHLLEPVPDKETLLRVPGFGTKSVGRILSARRNGALGYYDLRRIGASVRKAKPFIVARDWCPGSLTDAENLRARFAPPAEQLQLI